MMVTWADLAAALLAIAGVILALYGVLAVFAAGMASSPGDEARSIARSGCIFGLAGFVLFIASCAELLA